MHGMTVPDGKTQAPETRGISLGIAHAHVACFMLSRGRMLTELRAGLCLISLSLALLLPGPVGAIQRASPQSIRVTSGAPHQHSTGRSWGRYFAFSSPVDLTGEGSTAPSGLRLQHRRLRLPVRQARAPATVGRAGHLPEPGPALSGESHERLAGRTTSRIPSVNSSGTIVAFEAFGSYKGKCSGAAASKTPGVHRGSHHRDDHGGHVWR